jgi:hypothetical protein
MLFVAGLCNKIKHKEVMYNAAVTCHLGLISKKSLLCFGTRTVLPFLLFYVKGQINNFSLTFSFRCEWLSEQVINNPLKTS